MLEGNEDTVLSLFEKIKQDPRHEDLRMVMMQTVPKRHYTLFQNVDLDQYLYIATSGESQIR